MAERLKADPKSIKKVMIQSDAEAPDIEKACKSHKIPVERLPKNGFLKIAQAVRTQGVIAEVTEFKYTYLEDILRLEKEKFLTLLFLDNLNDPQNLGGILRTAACFGGFGVVLPRHDSVEVTEAVLRVAQGGENYVPVAKVANLSIAVEKAKKAGYWIAGAVIEGGQGLTDVKLNFPLGIVIGSEGKGIRPGLAGHLDMRLTLPMAGAELSFNAAVAAALFCYEAARQRTGK